MWSFVDLMFFWTGVPAVKLYKRIDESMRQFEEASGTVLGVLIPDPGKR